MRNSIISSTIKELRINKKISQEELSERTGLSLRTIQRLENGESIPRDDTLSRLTTALELPEDYFNNFVHENKQNGIKKKILIPWFIIGSFMICGSIGFMMSLFIATSELVIYELRLPLVYAITILFSGIGVIIGNFIEKKYRK